MAPGYSQIQTHSGARRWPGKWISWADGIRLGAVIHGRACQLLWECPSRAFRNPTRTPSLSGPSRPVPKEHTHTHTPMGVFSLSLTKERAGKREEGSRENLERDWASSPSQFMLKGEAERTFPKLAVQSLSLEFSPLSSGFTVPGDQTAWAGRVLLRG